MALRCQTPFQFSHSQLKIQTQNLKLSSSIIPITEKKKIKKSLVHSIPITPRFSGRPSLGCASSKSSASGSQSQSDSNDDSQNPSLFIKGLSKSTTEGRLRKLFAEFGRVKRVKVLTDEESGQSLGLAFVWFVNEIYTELAIKQLNGQFFDGRYISVSIPKGSTRGGQKKSKQYRF